MIDFRVAADKLAQFQTSDEIANYLGEQGIKATMQNGETCAIAVFMKSTTGEKVFVDQTRIYFKPTLKKYYMNLDDAEDTYKNTLAMRGFISNFDDGMYPELVEGEDQ